MHLPDSVAAPELFPGSGHTCALLPWLGGGCPAGREQLVCEQVSSAVTGHRGRGAELICAWAVLLSSTALCAVCSDPSGLSQGQEAGVLGASMFLNCSLGPLFCWKKLSKTEAKSGLQSIPLNFLPSTAHTVKDRNGQIFYAIRKITLSVNCVKGVDKSMFSLSFHSSYLKLTGGVVHIVLQLY